MSILVPLRLSHHQEKLQQDQQGHHSCQAKPELATGVHVVASGGAQHMSRNRMRTARLEESNKNAHLQMTLVNRNDRAQKWSA